MNDNGKALVFFIGLTLLLFVMGFAFNIRGGND